MRRFASWNPKVVRRRKPNVADTPAGKRLMKGKNCDSPCTAHTKDVLHILNTGGLKELEKFQSVGAKTAQQIILFRKIRGHMKRISDLSGIPGWGTKKFDRFVEQNFLKKQLI
ncbi:hypothetical protein JTB14_001774 [Gonioctena quinquepunctata]|nr:hypothetical protein JTB14_001774 [Gonioctena quinquepunctata]